MTNCLPTKSNLDLLLWTVTIYMAIFPASIFVASGCRLRFIFRRRQPDCFTILLNYFFRLSWGTIISTSVWLEF